MICKNCGTDVANELTFCTTCGEEMVHEEEKKSFFENKKLFAMIGGALAAVLLIVLVVVIFSGDPAEERVADLYASVTEYDLKQGKSERQIRAVLCTRAEKLYGAHAPLLASCGDGVFFIDTHTRGFFIGHRGHISLGFFAKDEILLLMSRLASESASDASITAS